MFVGSTTINTKIIAKSILDIDIITNAKLTIISSGEE